MEMQTKKKIGNFAKNYLLPIAFIGAVAEGPNITKSMDMNFSINGFITMSPLVEKLERGVDQIMTYLHGESNLYEKKKLYEPYVKEAADKYLGGDMNRVWAVMMTESQMNALCISNKGAVGLMQILPSGNAEDKSLLDPRTNIMTGISELVRYKRMFGSWELAYAAYNAGPNRESIRQGRIPDIKETQYYVPKVMAFHYCFNNMLWPVSGSKSREVNSDYGMRIHPIYHVQKQHYGIDIGAHFYEPVYAALEGKVVYAGWNGGSGQRVDIERTFQVKGSKEIRVVTYYSHLQTIMVKKGDTIKRGTTIGRVGSTGMSTGPHLDFKVTVAGMYYDPLLFLDGKENLFIKPNGEVVKREGVIELVKE